MNSEPKYLLPADLTDEEYDLILAFSKNPLAGVSIRIIGAEEPTLLAISKMIRTILLNLLEGE